MKWNSPEFMMLLLLIPLIAYYKFFITERVKKGGINYPLAGVIANAKTSWRTRLRYLPDLLRLISLVLIVFALMQPQYGFETESVTRQGIDIMIALDVSGTMAAEDFKPNRIKAAQKITEDFITGITDHRVGLVIFAGVALTQCPLTIDYGILVELLRHTSLGMMKQDGTAIGDAIVNAVYKFDTTAKEKRDKVIILLSDGENNAGIEPLTAAKIAADRGIRVYTIGVGSLEGAPVPYYKNGQKLYYSDYYGNLQKPQLDEQLLKDIAYITKGLYFRATDNEALESIYKKIATLEKGKIDVSRTMQYSERFFWFLLPAFALLAIEIYLRSCVFMRVF